MNQDKQLPLEFEGAIPVKFHLVDGPLGPKTRVAFDEEITFEDGESLRFKYDSHGYVKSIYKVKDE